MSGIVALALAFFGLLAFLAGMLQTRRHPALSGRATHLVVLCHGVGSDASDLISLAPLWSRLLPDVAFMAPDGPEPYDMAPMGRQWFSLSDRSEAAMEAGARAATPILLACIEAERSRLGLAADAVAIAGFSQGAMMALFAGLRRPVPPAAILAYSGGLIAPQAVAAEKTGAPATLIVHGLADQVVSAAWSRSTAATLKAAGVPTTTLFRPGLGHSIDDAGLAAGAATLREAFAPASAIRL